MLGTSGSIPTSRRGASCQRSPALAMLLSLPWGLAGPGQVCKGKDFSQTSLQASSPHPVLGGLRWDLLTRSCKYCQGAERLELQPPPGAVGTPLGATARPARTQGPRLGPAKFNIECL